MKKALICGTLAVVCVTGMFTLTGCSKKGEEGDVSAKAGTSSVQESAKEVKVSKDTSKWPSGVYDYYGIPEYKYGTFVYAEEEAKDGKVYFDTTFDDAKKYLTELEGKGLRYSILMEGSNKNFLYAKICASEPGKGFYVFFELETGERYVDVNGEDVKYTMCMNVREETYPEKNIPDNIATSYGLSNDAFLPKGVEIYEAKITTEDEVTKVEFDAGFDILISEDMVKTYHSQLIDECVKASDNGKITDYYNRAITVEKAKEDFVFGWNYTVGGKTYKVTFGQDVGLGVGYRVIFENN